MHSELEDEFTGELCLEGDGEEAYPYPEKVGFGETTASHIIIMPSSRRTNQGAEVGVLLGLFHHDPEVSVEEDGFLFGFDDCRSR